MTCIASGVPTGIAPDDCEVDAFARGGNVCAGYLYPLTLLQNATIASDNDPLTGLAYTLSLQPGGANSVWACVKGGTGVASSDGIGGIFVIALEDVLDEKKGRFKLRGLVRAYVENTVNTAIVIGNPLAAYPGSSPASLLNASIANVAGADVRRYIGHALEANASTPSTPVRMLVNFDGWHGFGGGNSQS